MSFKLAIEFIALKDVSRPARAKKALAAPHTLVVFAGSDLAMSDSTHKLLGGAVETVRRAAEAAPA